jgi:hypothetical protein
MSTNTNEIAKSINKFQDESRKIYENNIERINQYQNQIIDTSKHIADNYIELQKNTVNIYQSAYSQILENLSHSYWKDSNIPERFTDAYNTINKNILDNITDTTNFINEIVSRNIETANKSIEYAQRYFNDTTRNYFNYIRKLERPYNR